VRFLRKRPGELLLDREKEILKRMRESYVYAFSFVFNVLVMIMFDEDVRASFGPR